MPDLLERLTVALTDHYAVESEIGRGSTATVFLAEDLKHHRKVAIKLLHPELGAAVGPDRFLREIETVAGLDHPHILPLHDSGEADGLLYYVMPYVEGESLRDRLVREKQLPIEETIEIAREMADGLGYAHRHGVIHRDIKPANILLSEGHALIADFGVARAVGGEGQALTSTGLAVGTPAYMSPEQASGTEEVDGRSDLYALGCVLYEMLAGAPPLVGPTAQATASMRLTETATALPVLRDTVPGGLDQVTRKLLAKAPADRYPTAEKVRQALESTDIWATGKQRRSVRRKLVEAAVAMVLLAAGGYATTWFTGRTPPAIVPVDRSTLDPALYAVVPFQITGLDHGTGTRVAGYIQGLFNEWGTVRVADPVDVERSWREAGGANDRGVSTRAVVDIGRRFGAVATVVGSLEATADDLLLSAELISNVSGKSLGAARVSGSPDSLRALTERATIILLAQGRGMDREQGEILARHGARAAGLYFSAQTAEPDEARRILDQAIAIDSTFAMAALLKVRMGRMAEWRIRGRIGERPSDSDRIAWNLRDEMAPKDRLLAEASLAPSFDPPATAREQLRRWREAWQADAESQDVALEYMNRIAAWAGLLPEWGLKYGKGDAPWRSRLMEVAIPFCREYTLGVTALVVLESAAITGNADCIRDYNSRNPEWTEVVEEDPWAAGAAYMSWLLAIAEGDAGTAAEAADSVIEQSLRASGTGAWLFPAAALAQMAVLTGRSLDAADRLARWFHELAVNTSTLIYASEFYRERGRHADYRQLRDSLVAVRRVQYWPGFHARSQVFEWAYYGEPETQETLDSLDSVLAAEAHEAENPIDRASALCWQAQLRLHRGSAEGVEEAIGLLGGEPAYKPLAASRMCVPLLRLLLARSRDEDVLPSTFTLDQVMSDVPLDEDAITLQRAGGPFELLLDRREGQFKLLRAANLVASRALREAGYLPEGLAALRRRPTYAGIPYINGWQESSIGFVADYLREEAPLYVALGDTASAIERYERYFKLRAERPDFEPWAAQWDSARAEHAALIGVEIP